MESCKEGRINCETKDRHSSFILRAWQWSYQIPENASNFIASVTLRRANREQILHHRRALFAEIVTLHPDMAASLIARPIAIIQRPSLKAAYISEAINPANREVPQDVTTMLNEASGTLASRPKKPFWRGSQ